MKYIRLARLALALAPLSLALLALPSPAPAQAPMAAPSDGLPPGSPPLTPAQKQKQLARIARARQDAAAIRANAALAPMQQQQQLQALQVAVDKDMLAILTPQQRQAVVKQRTMVIGLHNQFVKQHQAEINQMKQLDQQLKTSMTSSQKQKMGLIQQQAQTQARKVMGDPKTTSDVKQNTMQAIGRDAVRQQMALMTPTQRAQVKQLQSLQTQYSQEISAFAKAHGQQ